MSSLSSFLFARPSFLEGWARIFDFGGTLQEYNRSANEQAADYYAIAADWRAVGQDIHAALQAMISQSKASVKEIKEKKQG